MEPVRKPAVAERAQSWAGRWPAMPDQIPDGRCRFVVSPPRRFLYPALLLLLAEEPRHGYLLGEALAGLGMGRVDRPSIYRALAQLEHDGLVRSWDAAPAAGSTRHVHAVTAEGEQALEAWMSVVSQERDGLEQVLQRFWYCNALRITEEDTGSEATEAARFEIVAGRSSLMVEARSSVGPIAFSATAITGRIEVELQDGLVAKYTLPSARMEVGVDDLRSGNAIYDRELTRRVDARRFPVVTIVLNRLSHMGEGNFYRVDGDVTMHGVTQRMDGVVTATVNGCRMIVAGEQVIDIRHFDMAVPTMPLLKIYPDVRLRLHLEADRSTR
ncbi:MAG: helix-turn-helix transcriptional regulator [Acidimicrobiales bacterium]